MSDATDLFFRLTPEHVLTAVERGGFEPSGHIQALHCFENRVHDIRLEDGTHIVTKFYRPGRWSREAVQQEHDFLAELREVEIPVCAPVAFEDGETVHEEEGIYYAVWPRVGGRSPDELDDEQIEILGRLLARIHNVGDAGDAPDRGVLDAETYGIAQLELVERGSFLPRSWAARYRNGVEQVCAQYRQRAEGVPVHRVHADCHKGNLLNSGKGWFFVDFDDMAVGPAVQDIWLLIAGQDAEAIQQRALLVEAYQQFRPFETRWLRLIEPLRALRFIRYAAWIARRWNDPAFKHAFPQFGTEQYWERETLDLENQVRKIAAEDAPY